jgi:twitching motility protein PilT
MAQRPLSDLDFVDLYVCLQGDGRANYNQPVVGKAEGENRDVPPEFQADIESLTSYLRDNFREDEMGVKFGGVRMRGAKAQTAAGQIWASLRRITAQPRKLEELGFKPDSIIAHLRALGKRDGLVLICGATGNGKTTTAAALLSDFLHHHGNVAFTIEDPVEFDLEGRRGNTGYCYQVEVHEDDQWAKMLKRSLRWHPRYIFVGEIRTPDAANQMLRAATSGHLVITTVHSGSIQEALEGVLQLGEQALGDRATLLLATGLTAVIHQTLTPLGLRAQFYITEPGNPGSPFRASIRDKRIGQTQTFIDQQMAILGQTGRLFRDGSN